MGREIEVIYGAVDVVDVALGQNRTAIVHPIGDHGLFIGAQDMLAMGFDVAVADVDDGDLVHLDPALPVLGRHPKDRRAVFTDAKVKFGKFRHCLSLRTAFVVNHYIPACGGGRQPL